jgi:hypothetical protein
VSGLVLVRFILPAMLDGHSPVAVPVVGSGVILFAVVYLAHGVNLRTTIALVGTLLSLGLTALLAVTFVHLSRLSGYSSEEASYVRAIAGGVDLQGLGAGFRTPDPWSSHRASRPLSSPRAAAMSAGRRGATSRLNAAHPTAQPPGTTNWPLDSTAAGQRRYGLAGAGMVRNSIASRTAGR